MLAASTGLTCCGWYSFTAWGIEYGPLPDVGRCAKCEKILEHHMYVEAL